MIRFNCHRCGMLMQAAESGVGRHAKCPGCGMILLIPKAAAAVPVPPPPPAATAPPRVTATARQAAMPVPPAGMAPPPPLSLDELLGDTSPPRPAGAKPSPVSSLVGSKKSAGSSGAHKLGGSGAMKTVKKKETGLSNTVLRNMAFAAMGVGLVGGGLFWIPFAGPIVAFAGLAVGLAAMFIGSTRRSAPMGLAMAGAGISFIAMAVGGYSTYASLNKPGDQVVDVTKTPGGELAPQGQQTPDDSAIAAKPAVSPAAIAARFAEGAALAVAGGDPRDDRDPLKFAAGAVRNVQEGTAKDTAVATARSQAKGPKPKLIFGADGSAVAVTEKPDAPSAASGRDKASDATEAAAPPIQWAAAEKKEQQGTGPLKVTITKVLVGPVPYYEIGGIDTLADLTRDRLMTIWVKVHNGDAAGNVEYSGWMGVKAEKEKVEATISDDHGHTHSVMRNYFKPEQAIKGSIQGDGPLKPIFAGQSVNDAVVFPLPAEDAEVIELTLSGKAIGQEEPLHFRIPKSMIKPDDSNPLIGGLGN